MTASLLVRSPAFSTLWLRNAARGKRLEEKRLVHPEVGALTLRMLSFDIRSSPGQELIVHQAEPGSASADALTLLARVSAERTALR